MSNADDPRDAASAEPVTTIKHHLLECAALLRQAEHLDPRAQQALADLVVELAGALDPAAASQHTAHLAECSAELARALHQQQDTGLVAAARRRLEAAAARAEAEAPVATGVARQLVDVLSGVGV
jgi:hypothetical protein